MTALVLAQRPALPDSAHWNWPRVGAMSGALSLHALAIILLLIPPAALQLMRATDEQNVVVTLIDPPAKPKEVPPPPDPVPIVRIRRQPAPTPPPVAPPAPVEAPPNVVSDMQAPPAAPPGPDAGGTAPTDTPPVALAYLTRTRVPYPKDALQRHEQGTVVLRVLVGADGVPQTVEIEKSSGSRSLDNAARDAVRKWTFTAGTRNGIAAPLWARVPISFTLQLL